MIELIPGEAGELEVFDDEIHMGTLAAGLGGSALVFQAGMDDMGDTRCLDLSAMLDVSEKMMELEKESDDVKERQIEKEAGG